MSTAEKFVASCRREREQFPLEPAVAQDARAEWIGWALDVLRRYAPDPLVVDYREDEPAERSWDEAMEDECGYHGDRR